MELSDSEDGQGSGEENIDFKYVKMDKKSKTQSSNHKVPIDQNIFTKLSNLENPDFDPATSRVRIIGKTHF